MAWIFKLIVILICISSAFSYQCRNQEEKAHSSTGVGYSYKWFFSWQNFKTIEGPVSKDLYRFDLAYLPLRTVISRQDDEGEMVWMQAIKERTSSSSVSMDSSETRAYFIVFDNFNLELVKINTSDGSLNESHKISKFRWQNDYCMTSLSPDESFLSFSAYNSHGSSSIWKWVLTTSNVSCVFLDGFDIPRTFSLIGQDRFYLTTVKPTISKDIFLEVLNFTGQSVWSKSLQWARFSCQLINSKSLHDEGTIYTLNAFGSAIVFIPLNSTNGEMTNSPYKPNTTCSYAYDMLKQQNKLYMLLYWASGSIIYIYDLNSNKFESYQIERNYRVLSIYYSSLSNFITFSGYGGIGNYCYTARTQKQALKAYPVFSQPSFGMIKIKDLQNQIHDEMPYNYETSLHKLEKLLVETEEVQINFNFDNTYRSPVSYWAKPLIFKNIPSFTSTTIDLDLTWNINQNYTNITYLSEGLPNWAKFDATKGQLSLSTPMTKDHNIYKTFNISTIVRDQNLFLKTPVTLNIVPCRVSQWLRCSSENSYQCQKCQDDYEIKETSIYENSCEKSIACLFFITNKNTWEKIFKILYIIFVAIILELVILLLEKWVKTNWR